MSTAPPAPRPIGRALAALAIGAGLELVLAHRWGLLADEAYYWVWSADPSWGYYDQPPMIAWTIAAVRASGGEDALALRAVPVLAGVLGPAALLPFARDPSLLAAWWLGVPALAWLTLFATPDALLLGLWAATLGAACAGGRGWLLAGVLGGLAILAKYPAVVLVPALVAAADPAERRSPWPWLGLAAAAVVVFPHAAWLAAHGGITVAFQLHEGLVHPDPPGPLGVVRHLGEQAGVMGPVAFGCGLSWLLRWPRDRVDRLCWVSAAPLVVGFAGAAALAPGDAHWPAPDWVGIGLGISRAGGTLRRAAWVGLGLGLASSAVLVAHAERPLHRWAGDPASRLTEGEGLAREVSRALVGVDLPIRAERYQEASLLAWGAGLAVGTAPGCGREDQFDLAGQAPLPDRFLLLRPARGGDTTCADGSHPGRGRWWRLAPIDPAGRRLGPWDLIEVHR